MEKNKNLNTEENMPVKATAKKAPASKPAPKVVDLQSEEEFEGPVYIRRPIVEKAMVGGVIGVIAGSLTLIVAQVFAIASFAASLDEGIGYFMPYFIFFVLVFAPNILTFAFSLTTIIDGRFRILAASFAIVSCTTSVLLIFV